MEILFLFSAGVLAGAVNALAGGGSFILFPALLLAGVPPVLANATNTYASLPGYAAGVAGYWRDMLKVRDKLLFYVIAALLGGYLGAELLLHVSDKQFSDVVPWLMAVAVILFTFGQKISQWASGLSKQTKNTARLAAAGLFTLLLLICIYGGFFNAGLGIVLLAFFSLAGMTDIHAMNGIKLLLSTVVAAIAVVRFSAAGSIAWFEGTLAFAGTLVGGYLAARLAHRVPTKVIRISIIVYGTALTAFFFYQTYWLG